jgi:hypothetical protein
VIEHGVITGVMPKWQLYLHKSAGVFMFLVFGGMGFMNVRLMIAGMHAGPNRAILFFSVLFVFFVVAAVTSQVWFHRRIISEFRYDGSSLQFRTIGTQEPQMRPLADIASIREWRGRGGPLGYLLQFQDKSKLYLEFSVSNSIALANRLRTHLGS